MKQPHICLDETLGVRYAILPGDPARLDRIAQQLEGVRELAYNREFRSLTGTYRGVPILAVSTGIGGSSAGICVEELHNIGVEAAIRIGSCGALQTDIAPGELLIAAGAVRDDGTSRAYVREGYPAVPDTFLPLGRILPAPGCYSEVLHLFLARNLHMGEQHLDPGEFLHVERIPFDEMVHRCLDGEIEDAKTVAAVLKAKVQLNL